MPDPGHPSIAGLPSGVLAVTSGCAARCLGAGLLNLLQLSGHLFLRGSTVSGMVDRLVGRGLIHRSRSEKDRRQVRVALSQGGIDLLTSLPQGQSKFGQLRQLVMDLPQEEARNFLGTLNKMVALLCSGGGQGVSEKPSGEKP